MTVAVIRSLSRLEALASRVVATKELIQVSNRGRFHAEATAVAAVVAGTWLVDVMIRSNGLDNLDWRQMAQIGRHSFIYLSLSACILLSLASLAASAGIILSEITGRRLDLLRVTSLSLATVVTGKGLAVMARSCIALVLLMPIMAAAQLLGGVTQAEVLRAIVIIVANVFVCTGIGLAASASKTAFGVAARAIVFGCLWLAVTSLPIVIMTTIMPGGSVAGSWGRQAALFVAALSPVTVWLLITGVVATSSMIAVNAAVQVACGFFFLWLTPRLLARTISRLERPKEQPKLTTVMRIRRLSLPERLSRKGKRKLADRWTSLPGSLVGGQILQSSLLAIIVPVMIACEAFPTYIWLLAFGKTRMAASDFASGGAILVTTAILLAVVVESCSMIAREKTRRTAEVLATTPAGGPGMVLWKAEALFGSQAAGLLVALILAAGSVQDNVAGGAVLALVFLGNVLMVYAICASFSLASRSPLTAVIGVVLVGILSGALARYALEVTPRYGYNSYYYAADPVSEMARIISHATTLGVLVVSLAAAALRNLFGRASWIVLAASLVVAFSSMPMFFAGTPTSAWYFPLPHLALLEQPDASRWIGPGLAVAAMEILVSAALLAGMPLRFNRALLRNVRAGG